MGGRFEAIKINFLEINKNGKPKRLHYYQYREKLISENPEVAKLPLITSHTGFTFFQYEDFIENQKFQASEENNKGFPLFALKSEQIKIGQTNDLINKSLHANPWSINLYDEEIATIMESDGMIGLSLDQRILGASLLPVDSKRKDHFDAEYVSEDEYRKFFLGKIFQSQESFRSFFAQKLAPGRQERHIMLLCLHVIHAVKVGYSLLNWVGEKTPWDHLCIGSDFDGMINPINSVNNITEAGNLESGLMRYLPQADKSHTLYTNRKALQYLPTGNVDPKFLKEVVEKIVFKNGLNFTTRFLNNWALS